MKRLTDKELKDAIERGFEPWLQPFEPEKLSILIAYAQLRALERLADNVEQVLAVIRADLVKGKI